MNLPRTFLLSTFLTTICVVGETYAYETECSLEDVMSIAYEGANIDCAVTRVWYQIIHNSEGVPGALVVLNELKQLHSKLSVDVGIFEKMLHGMEQESITGSNLWVLYKNVFREDAQDLYLLLYAFMDGEISPEDILRSIDDQVNFFNMRHLKSIYPFFHEHQEL